MCDDVNDQLGIVLLRVLSGGQQSRKTHLSNLVHHIQSGHALKTSISPAQRLGITMLGKHPVHRLGIQIGDVGFRDNHTIRGTGRQGMGHFEHFGWRQSQILVVHTAVPTGLRPSRRKIAGFVLNAVFMDVDDQERQAVLLASGNVILRRIRQPCSLRIAISHTIHELRCNMVGVESRNRREIPVLADSQQQHAALGVGERAHTLPHAGADGPRTGFRLEMGVIVALDT